MVPNIAVRPPVELSRYFADRAALYRCRWDRRRPETFSERLLYKMVWDRRPIPVSFADKVKCADYIVSRIGPGYGTKNYVVTDDLALVRRSDLPENFVVRNSHLPDDLRFFVFNRQCRMIRVARGIVGGTETIDEFWPDGHRSM